MFFVFWNGISITFSPVKIDIDNLVLLICSCMEPTICTECTNVIFCLCLEW